MTADSVGHSGSQGTGFRRSDFYFCPLDPSTVQLRVTYFTPVFSCVKQEHSPPHYPSSHAIPTNLCRTNQRTLVQHFQVIRKNIVKQFFASHTQVKDSTENVIPTASDCQQTGNLLGKKKVLSLNCLSGISYRSKELQAFTVYKHTSNVEMFFLCIKPQSHIYSIHHITGKTCEI